MTNPREQVDGLLEEVPPRQTTRSMDGNPELVEAIRYFMELKAAHDPRAHVSFSWFYRNKLKPKFGGPGHDAVYRYVRDVMRLDVKTGNPLTDG